MTEVLQIANRLMEASEVLRRLFPDTYDEKSRQEALAYIDSIGIIQRH